MFRVYQCAFVCNISSRLKSSCKLFYGIFECVELN